MKQQKSKNSIILWIILLFFLTLVLLAVDLHTKHLFYTPQTGVLNTGSAWWIPISPWISLVVGIAILFYVGYLTLYREFPKGVFLLLSAGILGNSYDRALYSGVRDWIDINSFLPFSFPVFNLADIYITIGVILLCIVVLFSQKQGRILS